MTEMHFTGERMVPGTPGRDELFFEHVVRYAFAARRAPGRRVLDAGCGCGYGAHFLSRSGAAEVLGIDLDPASVHFSRERFDHDGLRFAVGDVLELPVADASFDLVTCFEVFEHLDAPDRLLAELRRVLTPDGVLVISTPNALTYEADTADGTNPFHHREYAPDELRERLSGPFENAHFYVQNPFGGMGIFPMDRSLDAAAAVELRVLSPPAESLWGEPREIHAAAEKCAYVIAECGATEVAREGRLFAMASDLSDTTLERRQLDAYVEQLTEEYGLLKDQQASSSEWVRDILEQLALSTRELEALRAQHATLESEYAKQEAWLRQVQQTMDESAGSRLELEDYLAKVEEQLERTTSSRLELEAYIEELTKNLESEKAVRTAAEARCRELEEHAESVSDWAQGVEKQALAAERSQEESADERARLTRLLEEASGWARGMESELEKSQAELERLYAAELERGDRESERTAWAQGLEKHLLDASAELENARAELARQEEHGRSLEAWAHELAEKVETLEASAAESAPGADERAEIEAWAHRLEAELAAKSERLDAVEAAHAELESHEQERRAWAEEQAALLEQSRREIVRLEAEIAERTSREAERDVWARGLEEALLASQAEIERLRAEHEELAKNDARRALWARDLERRLIDAGENPGEVGTGPILTPAG